MRKHYDCTKRCQYARDVGRPEDHCAVSCVYQEIAEEHTEHVKAVVWKVVRRIALVIVGLLAIVLLTGCGDRGMSYEEVKEREEYCTARGLQPYRVPPAFTPRDNRSRAVGSVICMDVDGTQYDSQRKHK